ncbi:MAG: hypothetical protein JJE08_09635 [Proteiniphilum sp.]|nr:hypothetical protein [Proteiniphilum sp.]
MDDKNIKKTANSVWNLKNEKIPYVVDVGGILYALEKFYWDHQRVMEAQDAYHKLVEPINDYSQKNYKPDLGIGFMAAVFGCDQVPNDKVDPWITPLITHENQEDVLKIPYPDLSSNPVMQHGLERIDFLNRNGKAPMRLINVASPLVTASYIWEYNSFLEGMLMEPKKVHYLLDMITTATIEFIRLQLGRIRNLYSMSHENIWVPRSVGVRISDDVAAILSPDLYREFGKAYNERIAEAFGGLMIHSCGDLQHVLPVMLETKGCRGIDLTIPQNDPVKVRDMAGGKTTLNLRFHYWDFNEKKDLAAYAHDLLELFPREGVMLWTSEERLEDSIILAEKLCRMC